MPPRSHIWAMHDERNGDVAERIAVDTVAAGVAGRIAADTVAAPAAAKTVAVASAAADGTIAAASDHRHVTATAHSTPQTTDAVVGVHLAVVVCSEYKIVCHRCPYLLAPHALQSPSPCLLTLQHPILSSYIPFFSLLPFLSSSPLSLLLQPASPLLFILSSSPVLQPASSGLPRLTLYCDPGALQSLRYIVIECRMRAHYWHACSVVGEEKYKKADSKTLY